MPNKVVEVDPLGCVWNCRLCCFVDGSSYDIGGATKIHVWYTSIVVRRHHGALARYRNRDSGILYPAPAETGEYSGRLEYAGNPPIGEVSVIFKKAARAGKKEEQGEL